MIPTPPPADWVRSATEYARLDFWTVPYQWYLDQITSWTPFALARWSDGEWPCVLGDQGANTDRHPYSPELRRDLTATLRGMVETPAPYLVGLQELVVRQHPLNARVHAWMEAHGLTIDWVSGEVFHRASVTDQIWALIDALRDREGPILVGPRRLRAMEAYFPLRSFIEVPLVNCHQDAERLIRDVRDALTACEGSGCPPVVSVSASMSAKYLIPQIHQTHPHATILDMGSVWEPYVGVACRTYHQAIVDRLRQQGRL